MNRSIPPLTKNKIIVARMIQKTIYLTTRSFMTNLTVNRNRLHQLLKIKIRIKSILFSLGVNMMIKINNNKSILKKMSHKIANQTTLSSMMNLTVKRSKRKLFLKFVSQTKKILMILSLDVVMMKNY